MEELVVNEETMGETSPPLPDQETDKRQSNLNPDYFKGFVFDPGYSKKLGWNKEKREEIKRKRLEENPLSSKRSMAWTPEKKAKQRERVMRMNEAAKDKIERQKRILAKTRYLKKTDTGEIFVYNPYLAQRPDMIEVTGNEIPRTTDQNSE